MPDHLKKLISTERWMYQLLIEKEVQDSFPNVEIAFRIYLVVMSTNSTSERSFSKLNFVQNEYRTSMTQERLNSLAIMSLERDILRKMNFNDVIDEFSNAKARKVQL